MASTARATGAGGAMGGADAAAEGGAARVYYVYLVCCEDDTLYTGIATDLSRRLAEHLSQRGVGAKYTRAHRVVALEMAWRTRGRSAASKLEYRVKRLGHGEKQQLIAHPSGADALVDGACGRAAASGHGRLYQTVPSRLRAAFWERAQAALPPR